MISSYGSENDLTNLANMQNYNILGGQADCYNPWGKPGGGAPKMDTSGQLKTKIVGTLKWNLNGETEEDRIKRLANVPKSKNTLLYKKTSPQNDARRILGQSYNFNSGSNQHLNGSDQQQNQITSSQFENMTQIEREAQARMTERQSNNLNVLSKSGNWVNQESTFVANPNRKTAAELNRISNKLYNDNQPTPEYPNDPFWFGRAGTHKTMITGLSQSQTSTEFYQDARRRKLLDALENRHTYENSNLGTHGLTPRGGQPPPHIPNYTNIPKVPVIAHHNNIYNPQPQQQFQYPQQHMAQNNQME